MKYKAKLVILFLAAFVVRLIALDQSLWLDEATSAKVVQQFSFSQIITQFSPADFHPPLYYLLLKLWTNFFGYSEIALRLPSIIFSLLAGWFVYLLGRRLYGGPSTSLRTNFSKKSEKFGFWSAIFFLFNPLIIYYSQEARMYMMATFLLTGGLHYFVQYQKSNIKNQKHISKIKNILLFNIFIILGFYTFYGSIFLIVPVLFYLLYKKRYQDFFVSCFILYVSLLIVSPLLYKQILNSKNMLTSISNWTMVLGQANLKNLILIPIKFSFGRISFYPKIVYYLVAGIWTLIVWFFVFKGGVKVVKLFYLLVFPLIFGFLLSFFIPLLQYFRFLYLVSIMSLLLAQANGQLLNDRIKVVMAVGFLILSLIYLIVPQFHREDWKGLVASFPKGATVFIVISSADPVQYYRRDIKIEDLKTLENAISLEKKIIVIPYTADIHGVDYQKMLQEKNFHLKDKKSFRELTVETYSSNL